MSFHKYGNYFFPGTGETCLQKMFVYMCHHYHNLMFVYTCHHGITIATLPHNFPYIQIVCMSLSVLLKYFLVYNEHAVIV